MFTVFLAVKDAGTNVKSGNANQFLSFVLTYKNDLNDVSPGR